MKITVGKSKRIMASEDYATLRGMDFRKARDILTKDGFHEHEYGDKDDNNGYAVYRKGDKEVELQYRWNAGKRKDEYHAGKVTNVYVDDDINSACGKKSVKSGRLLFPWEVEGEFADGYRYTAKGNSEAECVEKLGDMQDKHGELVWYSGTTDEYYDAGHLIDSACGKKSVKSNKHRGIKASRTLEIFTFDELTPEQQDYVLRNWSDMRKLAEVIDEWHSEDMMFGYNDEAQYIADQYASKYGLSINPDKLYWQSNSQGPYPEWNFEQVFDDYEFNGTDGEYYAVEFYGRGLDVQSDVSGAFYDDISAEDQAKVDEITSHAQEYIDEMWNYINDVCQAYPDDEWAAQCMESNPESFEFTISDSGEVKYY